MRLAGTFEQKGLLIAQGKREYDITPSGEQFLEEWDINVSLLRRKRRSFAHRCVDWTERRDHLAGSVGAAICEKMLEFRWITRDRNSRAVRVTLSGHQHLEHMLSSPSLVRLREVS